SEFGQGFTQQRLDDKEKEVLSWLKDGAVPLDRIEEMADKIKGLGRTELYAIKKRFDIQKLSGADGEYWVRAVDVKFSADYIVVEEETKATRQELIKMANNHRRYQEKAINCLNAMLEFSKE